MHLEGGGSSTAVCGALFENLLQEAVGQEPRGPLSRCCRAPYLLVWGLAVNRGDGDQGWEFIEAAAECGSGWEYLYELAGAVSEGGGTASSPEEKAVQGCLRGVVLSLAEDLLGATEPSSMTPQDLSAFATLASAGLRGHVEASLRFWQRDEGGGATPGGGTDYLQDLRAICGESAAGLRLLASLLNCPTDARQALRLLHRPLFDAFTRGDAHPQVERAIQQANADNSLPPRSAETVSALVALDGGSLLRKVCLALDHGARAAVAGNSAAQIAHEEAEAASGASGGGPLRTDRTAALETCAASCSLLRSFTVAAAGSEEAELGQLRGWEELSLIGCLHDAVGAIFCPQPSTIIDSVTSSSNLASASKDFVFLEHSPAQVTTALPMSIFFVCVMG